jgi:hypothetical protein
MGSSVAGLILLADKITLILSCRQFIKRVATVSCGPWALNITRLGHGSLREDIE